MTGRRTRLLRPPRRLAKQVGLGALETFSRGTGAGRYISIMRTGSAPKRVSLLTFLIV